MRERETRKANGFVSESHCLRLISEAGGSDPRDACVVTRLAPHPPSGVPYAACLNIL